MAGAIMQRPDGRTPAARHTRRPMEKPVPKERARERGVPAAQAARFEMFQSGCITTWGWNPPPFWQSNR